MKILGAQIDVPRYRGPSKKWPLILEAGDRWGDELSSAAAGDGDEDSPGPEVRARLEGRALLDLLCGTGEGTRGPILV